MAHAMKTGTVNYIRSCGLPVNIRLRFVVTKNDTSLAPMEKKIRGPTQTSHVITILSSNVIAKSSVIIAISISR